MRPRYESQVELVTSEIGSDVAYYLDQSEQRRCAIAVGVDIGPRGIVSASGFLVEALPDATSESVTALESNFRSIDPISRTVPEHGLLGVAQILFSDASTSGERPLEYRCRCSVEQLSEQLGAMPATEIAALSDGDVIEAQCAYCGTVYELSEAALLKQSAGSN